MMVDGTLRIETVDSSQGSEADYVVLSMVRTPQSHQTEHMRFINDPRRLCVAISRAKQLLLVVGHAKTFQTSSNEVLKDLLQVVYSIP